MPVDIEPRDLGLPPRFSAWRPGQLRALYTTAESAARFIAQCAPTGFGKSMYAIACALLFGTRVCVITSTKMLQGQYQADFGTCGMVDIRGSHNYRCPIAEKTTCADGKLMGCKSPTCPKSLAMADAKAANLVVTNYPCFLHSYVNGEGLGEFGMLILDEAHSIVDELCSFLEIEFTPGAYDTLYDSLQLSTVPRTQDPGDWRKWAAKLAPRAKERLDELKQEQANVLEIRQADRLYNDLNRITQIGDDWIIDGKMQGETYGYTFSPLWPTAHAERLLFRKVPKVILLSATIVRKTLDLLGIPSPDSLLLDQASGFDPNRAPVYLFGPSKIDFRATEGQLVEQAARMDMLISRRLDRKGIIHTVSYARQKDIVARSQFSSYMLAPPSYSLAGAVTAFREADPPKILASPALTTGYDFAGRAAEYQFLLKMMFIDRRSNILKARSASDPDYLSYLTAQDFQQTCGRIMRAPDDRGESIVLDAHANWFLKKHRALFTAEFLRRVRYSNGPPPTPPILSAEAIDHV